VIEDSKPLEPLAKLVSTALRLLIGFLLAGFALSLINNDVPVWGSTDGCITADWISGTSSTTENLFGAREGTQVNVIPQYCAPDPSTYQRLLGILSEAPNLIVLTGGLTVLNRLLRSAIQDGMYTAQTASRLRLLGWWILIGTVVAEITQAAAQTALLTTVTDKVTLSIGTFLHTFEAPYLALLTALGILTFARIVGVGSEMRKDLEGTV
jgi:hypothetical protein